MGAGSPHDIFGSVVLNTISAVSFQYAEFV